MEIKQLKYFMQICDDESFTRAAKNLYITQQGLSKAIKKLEAYLDTTLFYRTAFGVELTESGIYLRDHSQIILNEMDLISNKLQEIAAASCIKKLSVGFSLGVIVSISSELITNFQSTYPNIALSIIECPDFLCEDALLKETIDIALTIGPVDLNKFNAIKIKTQKPHALVNKSNPLSKKTSIDFIDLINEKIILVNEDFKIHHNFIEKCEEIGFKPNIIHTAAEIFVPYNLSRLNKGIGITLDFVSTDIYYPNVSSIPFTDDSFTWDVYMITKQNKKLSDLESTFFNYILNLNSI